MLQLNPMHSDWNQQKGHLFVLLAEALKQKEASIYQPPMSTDRVDKEQERLFIEECQDAEKEVDRLAKSIYFALTGKNVKR